MAQIMRVRSPVVKALTKMHPQVKWKAVRHGFGWGYVGDNGWNARWVSALAPQYDGDDDHFVSQFWIYKTSTNETPEMVFL